MNGDTTIIVALCGAIGAMASAIAAMAVYVYRDAIRRAELSEHREGDVLQEIIKILGTINPSLLSMLDGQKTMLDGQKTIVNYVVGQEMRAKLLREGAQQ